MKRRSVLVGLVVGSLLSEFSPASGKTLHYEPSTVALDGIIKKERWYGPPNFGEEPEHDILQTIFVLYLYRPLSVVGRPETVDSESFSDLWRIQIDDAFLPKLSRFVGRRVRLVGTLFEHVDGSHRTPVIIRAKNLVALPRRA